MPSPVEPLIVEFMRYNTWANDTLLEFCKTLNPEQLSSKEVGAYGTISDTWEHIVDSEAHYYYLLTRERRSPPFRWEDAPSLLDIKTFAAQLDQAFIQKAASVRTDDLVQEQDKNGTIFRYKAVVILIQTIDHGIEHRTNITTLLSQLGLHYPDIDAWSYLSANPDRLGPG